MAKAYGFFNYNKSGDLIRLMKRIGNRANFTDLTFKILNEDERRELQPELVQVAKKTQVYGTIPINCTQKQFHKLRTIKPVSAYELTHVVEGKVPGPITHFGVASMLNEILRGIGFEKYKGGIFRGTTLYQKSTGSFESL